MKSYFLDKLDDEAAARTALSDALPHWVEPWLLKDDREDVVAVHAEIGEAPPQQRTSSASAAGPELDVLVQHLARRSGRIISGIALLVRPSSRPARPPT